MLTMVYTALFYTVVYNLFFNVVCVFFCLPVGCIMFLTCLGWIYDVPLGVMGEIQAASLSCVQQNGL